MPHHGEAVGGAPGVSDYIFTFNGGDVGPPAGGTRHIMKQGLIFNPVGGSHLIGDDVTVTDLYCYYEGAPGIGENIVFIIDLNGVPTVLTATIAGAATVAVDLVNTFNLVAGQRIACRIVCTNNGAFVSRRIKACVLFTPI